MDNETTWDTDETSRIIANDEGLYNIAIGIARRAIDIDDLAERMEGELSDIITGIEYSDVDMSLVDWTEIASEYMEDDTEDDDIPLMCTCDACGCDFKEDDLVTQHYAEYPGASMQPMYVSPCCNADYEYTDE